MKRLAIVLTALVLAAPALPAWGQVMNARRTAMGGVVLPWGGPGSDAGNVAYRAIPTAPGSSTAMALPIGLLPLIANPPVLDPDDPAFNLYELANTLYNPPFHLQLVSAEAPSTDVVIEIGRNHLAVELGSIADLLPDDDSRLGGSGSLPALGVNHRNFFATATAMVQYQNHLSLNPALHDVLAEGQAFQTNTSYALNDNAAAQAAGVLQLGWAGAIRKLGQPRVTGGSGIYAGARAKLMRGLAYGETQNTLGFITADTLFSAAPINLDYAGTVRQAGPGGGGWGQSLDVGLVWANDPFEVGVGVNDLVSRMSWNVEESIVFRDPEDQEFVRQVVNESIPLTTSMPVRATLNGAARFGGTVIAADVTRSMGRIVAHAGIENWRGPIALRAGCGLDPNLQVQLGSGVGLKLGRVGLDLGVATHSRNLSRERGVELAAGLALYR